MPGRGHRLGRPGEGVTERIRADAPGYAAEYQAGAIDLRDAGSGTCRELTGVPYMKYFQKNNLIASGATLLSYYLGFGGTDWGWLGQPNDVYTSYDYGAAITEARQLTAKYDEFKRQTGRPAPRALHLGAAHPRADRRPGRRRPVRHGGHDRRDRPAVHLASPRHRPRRRGVVVLDRQRSAPVLNPPGLARVLVTGGGRRPLLLMLGTDDTAAEFWRADTPAGPVLVRGTDLLRSATWHGGELALRVDTAIRSTIEMWAPGAPAAGAGGTQPGLPGRLAPGSPSTSGRSRPMSRPAAR